MSSFSIAELEQSLNKQLIQASSDAAVKARVQKDYDQIHQECEQLESWLQDNREARVVIQEVERSQQAALKVKLEKFVSFALCTIFDRQLQFVLDFTTRGSQFECHFMVLDENGLKLPVKDAHGGGILVVASFILRVIVLLSSRPALKPIIFLDEPFAQISENHQETLGNFLKKFAQSAGVQLVIITHSSFLSAVGDKHYHFTNKSGITHTELV